MRRFEFAIALLSVLFGIAAASASEGGEPADGAALAERDAVVRSLRRRLAVVEDGDFGRRRQPMSRVVSRLRSLDRDFSKLVDDDAVAAARARPHSRLRALLEAGAYGAFGELGSLIGGYRSSHGGEPPERLGLLEHQGFVFPVIDLPDHGPSAEPRQIRRMREASIENYFEDSGRWLYIADPKSPEFGRLAIDCSHRNSSGRVWHDLRLP
jgi:hypothetical protein